MLVGMILMNNGIAGCFALQCHDFHEYDPLSGMIHRQETINFKLVSNSPVADIPYRSKIPKMDHFCQADNDVSL